MAKVTGIGGFFFKCHDPEMIKQWYARHLGAHPFGMQYPGFLWRENAEKERLGFTSWGAFSSDTQYFQPSQKPFMINFRVDDLAGLLASLREAGCLVDDKTEDYPYGKFGWVMDPEGNRLELWEPPSDLKENNSFATADEPVHVTGLGGLFFKAQDPDALKAWYCEKLGIVPDKHGFMCFHVRDAHDPDLLAYTVLSFFKDDTRYFDPSNKPYMPNYRVKDLDALLVSLAEEGVALVGEPQNDEYGKFGWVLDPEGVKVELWQPPR